MTTEITEIRGEYSLKYLYSDEVKNKIFKRLMRYYNKYEAYDGETIMQSDDPQIYAPEVLSDIAENIIEFDVTYSEIKTPF